MTHNTHYIQREREIEDLLVLLLFLQKLLEVLALLTADELELCIAGGGSGGAEL